MTSVEKRRSGRKGGSHRKHSDGGYSDTSSGGSFLDETDREVSNLTDRAFRSLCIGDEAVYNDSDLCSSSPCFQRDRQLAFAQSSLGRDQEDTEELKRAAHESFSLRMQHYGQDWLHEGMFGADLHRDPQWEVYGQNTQGRISTTFQQSFMETSQQEKSLREEHLSFLSNGATDLGLQQRRSRSRVSSLIRAFNSEGQRDGSGMDGKLREWNDETSWDKSALMSIQRELSEFSYQQNFNNGHFPSAGPFSPRDPNCYASEVAAVTHMNSDSSFLRSSHSTHNLSAHVNCNSNFFIHSEYSPFKIWRDHNRFPFKQGEVSGFMPRSEFPKWYETPMYKELSLETHPQGLYRFPERGINHPRSNTAHAIHPSPPRATSTSTVLQKTLAVEKRCESELASHRPHRKRAQSLGNSRLPSQRPSTASPTTEVSQRVRDTIRSAEALRHKIQMITEQNMAAGFTTNQQEAICRNASVAAPPDFTTCKSSMTPFSVSQMLTPVVHAETSEVPQYTVSPQPVEHPPVRAESRGATPDVRMSSYKSRATSLLFNLKDNRKRVKSTYSPTKFRGLDVQEKSKQSFVQEPRDTVIDIPDFLDSDIQFPNIEEASRTNAALHQNVNQYHSTVLSRTTLTSQPATAYPEYTLNTYPTAQIQGETVHHPGFTDTSNQLVNGQNLQENSMSSAPYKQAMIDPGHAHKTAYIAAETQRLNTDNNQIRDYSISEANTEQRFNEKVGREFTKVDRYQQLKNNKHDYSNVSSQGRQRPTNSQDIQKLSLKADISPWKQEITAPTEKDQYAPTSQRAAVMKEERNLSRDKYRRENQQSLNKELRKTELGESINVAASHQTNAPDNSSDANQLPQYAAINNNVIESQANFGQQLPGAHGDKNILQTYYRNTDDNEMKENYRTQSFKRHNLYNHKDTTMLSQETAQRKQTKQDLEMQESLQPTEPTLQLQEHTHNSLWSHSDRASNHTMTKQVKERQFVEVKSAAEHIKAQHARAELAKAQPLAQVESARLILAGHTSSENGKAEEANTDVTKCEKIEQAKAEQIKEQKVEDKETFRERQPEPVRVRRVTGEPRIMAKEAAAVYIKEREGEQEKVENRESKQARQQQNKQSLSDRIQADEEQVRAEQVEGGQIEAEQMKTEKVKAGNKVGNKENLTEAEQSTTQTSKLQGAEVENQKGEEAKLEHTKVELIKAELARAKNVDKKWMKPAEKPTTTQQVKTEPDKIEQVKTELAKAKAELAKIKEKMRGEQKGKARNTVGTKEDNVKNRDVSLGVKSNKTSDYSLQDKTQANQQQRENRLVRGADDYERLREKYGFTNAVSTSKSTVSTVDIHNAKETPALSLDKVEAMNTQKSNPENSPATAKIEITGMTESQYVYSESSKEFKLTSTVDNKQNIDTVADKIKDYSVEKSDKSESAKQTDVPLQRDPDLTKQLVLERKPKLAEHSTAPSKESRLAPPRALSHKDKVQSKQEILTSRIKAHAEKEISALKEKGLAMRDGFIAKNATKHVAAGQSVRQRPTSHDVTKKQGSTASSNIRPKHQMELSGIQMAPAETVSPLSPAATPVTSASSQLVDHSQKQVPTEPERASDFMLEPHIEAKQAQSCAMSLNTGLMESEEKQEANPEEKCGKTKERLNIDNPVLNTSHLNKENKRKEESKEAPSLNLSFGHNEGPVADDNLQIMGIRVTVRERKSSMEETQVDNITLGQMGEEGDRGCDSKSHPSLNSEVCPEKDSVIQETHPAAKKDVATNNQHLQEKRMIQEKSEQPNIQENTEEKTTDTHMGTAMSATRNDKNISDRVGAETEQQQNVHLLVKEEPTTVMKLFGNRETDGESGPFLEQKVLDSAAAKQFNTCPSSSEKIHIPPELQYTGTNTEQSNEVDDEVHIDSIAIRVVPAVTEKLNIAPIAADVVTANEPGEVAASVLKEHLTPTSTEAHMQDSLEDALGAKYVRKLSESQKSSSQQNSINTIKVKNLTEDEKPTNVKEPVAESNLNSMEGDYFQVQGLKETNYNNDSSDGALKTNNKESASTELHKEGNVLCQSNTVQLSSGGVKNETIKKKISEKDHQMDSKQSDGKSEEQSNKKIPEVGQDNHRRKSHTNGQSILTRENQRSRHSHSPRESEVKEKSEVKPKERISTIPEISALADYARLKVIVSEDHTNTVQDFSPNKKEGFFPLIQTRHSRRPVSTVDCKDIFEKDSSFPNKMDVNAKVNKEPKALVFPITEKEHQRTGMFKLGDKDKQDKLPIDVKSNEQHLTEINKSPTQHVDELGTQRSSQRGQSVYQAISQTLQNNSSWAVKETRNTYGLTNSNKNSASGTTLTEQENKKATEKENMAIKIQEKQEKMREADRIREEEIKLQTDEQRAALLLRTRQLEEEMRKKDEEKSRINIVEETKTKLTGWQEHIKDNHKRKELTDRERAAQEEHEKRAAQEEQPRRDAEEEQQRKTLQKEQQRRDAQEEQQRRDAQEEQRRKTLQKEQQMRDAQEEQRRKTLQEEQQRRDAQEEQQRRDAQEEQRRKTLQKEQQRRDAQEEQQRKTLQKEQQTRDAQEEQQRKTLQKEQQRRDAQEEQQRKTLQKEQQRRDAQEEQQRRDAQEEQRRKTLQEEQQRRDAQEEQQRRDAQEEQRRKTLQKEQQRRDAQEEQQRKTLQKEQQRRDEEEQKWRALSDEQMQTRQIDEKIKPMVEDAQTEEEWIKNKQVQKRTGWQTEDYRRERQRHEETTRNQREEEGKAEKEKATRYQTREDESRAKRREEEIKLEAHGGIDTGPEMEEEKRASQRMDALQYYAITSTEAEQKPRERQRRNNPSGPQLPEDSGSHSRLHRPQAPVSPALSLPRSNTSSPALGAKPSMFRVKDNTTRGSSMTRSVKPRYHKSFGEDLRVGSPMDRGEEDQEVNRRSAVTPANLDTGLNRLGTIKEASAFNPASSSQDYPPPQHRPYSRRSLALDEDDSRSVISNMSEGGESFASCATDVASVRGLLDYERPESACSFSSDVSRSMGKPPAVPPKSEKALQRAKRLTSRRIKKELSKAASELTGGVEKPPVEVSSSTEASNHHAVASAHFSPPVSLAHAPTLGSSDPSWPACHQSSHHSGSHGSPHATGPIALPAALPHATAPVSLTVVSPHAPSSASKTVAHVASSPTHHHANQPAPVAKYHVEPNYPQSYPLTQRKVLQDLGSGQYYVVDVPVQVKTKTFFDPETGNYVQLNVRESGQSTSRPRAYAQSHLQPQVKVNPQLPVSQASPAGKPFLFYQGYHGYPQNCQPIGSMPPVGSSVTLHQDQQPVRETHSCAYPGPEAVQSCDGHRYSPEKTPYMDTVSNTEKTLNRVNNTAGSCDTNSQRAGSSVRVNDTSAHCDIIPMSELEDFMDVSDW